MLPKNKNKDKKLTSEKKVLEFLESIESSIDLSNFVQFLKNKTEDQILEFASQFGSVIKKETQKVQRNYESNKTSERSDHGANFGCLFDLIANSKKEFVQIDGKFMTIEIENDQLIELINKTKFRNNWFIRTDKNRFFAKTKFNSFTDVVGFRSLQHGVMVEAKKDTLSKKDILIFRLITNDQYQKILKELDDQKKSVFKTIKFDVESKKTFNEFKTFQEFLDARKETNEKSETETETESE